MILAASVLLLLLPCTCFGQAVVIDSFWVDESRKELIIHTLAAQDVTTVSVGGSILPNLQIEANTVSVAIPDSGVGSFGEVVVRTTSGALNLPVTISAWYGSFSYFAGLHSEARHEELNRREEATITIHLRHPVRPSASGRYPLAPLSYLQSKFTADDRTFYPNLYSRKWRLLECNCPYSSDSSADTAFFGDYTIDGDRREIRIYGSKGTIEVTDLEETVAPHTKTTHTEWPASIAPVKIVFLLDTLGVLHYSSMAAQMISHATDSASILPLAFARLDVSDRLGSEPEIKYAHFSTSLVLDEEMIGARLEVYDVIGRMIISRSLDDRTVSLANLPAGMYIARIGARTLQFIR